MLLSVGDKLGPYEILATLGAGGMGEVYRARDSRLGRDVAIKVAAEKFSDRFEREARAVAALNHPNIGQLYDVGPSYLVMELIEGPTLAERIVDWRAAAHRCVKHRPAASAMRSTQHIRKGSFIAISKPNNILLTESARGYPSLVKILIFGLAKIREERGRCGRHQHGNADRADATGGNDGNGRLHVARAGAWTPGQSPDGYLLVRGGSLRRWSREFVRSAEARRWGSAMRSCMLSRATSVTALCLESSKPSSGCSSRRIRRTATEAPTRSGKKQKSLESSLAPARPMTLSRSAWIATGAVVALAVVLAGWLWHRSSRERWALETAAPEITRLVDAGEYVKAAALTREARAILPKDPTLEKLWVRATGEVSIASVPADADVSIRLYRGDQNAWEPLGKTPLRNIRVPGGRFLHLACVAKPGFATAYMIGQSPNTPAFGYGSPFNPVVSEPGSRKRASPRDGNRRGRESLSCVPSKLCSSGADR